MEDVGVPGQGSCSLRTHDHSVPSSSPQTPCGSLVDSKSDGTRKFLTPFERCRWGTYPRYHALLVLGDIDGSFDLVAERRLPEGRAEPNA